MVTPADPMGTRPLRAVESIIPTRSVNDPQREVFDRLTHIALGKTFQAEVLSRLNDGTYLIKLDNAALRASLPGDPQVGTALSLRLVATQPRPTFLILQAASNADTASLSSAAKLINLILHVSQRQGMAEGVVGKVALLPDASVDASKIATALKHALAGSGVFYESHLSQWASGNRSLMALQQEPQAQLDASVFRSTPSLPQGGPSRADQLVDIVFSWDNAVATASAPSASSMDSAGKELMQLMNLQLQALEQQKFIWQGELWPGQPLEWEVSEDPQQGQSDEDMVPSWTSTVRFSLPALGTVSATIRMAGDQMAMQLRAASEQTADLLREHGVELAGALDAAGSPLDALTVKQDDQA